MAGEFCLLRGVDEGCLLSLCEAPGENCVIKLSADHRAFQITSPLSTLAAIGRGETVHLAGPDGLCGVQRNPEAVRFQFVGSDRRSRSYEVATARFDAALAMLSAGRYVLGTLS